MSAIRFHVQDVMLAILFVGVFTAFAVFAWDQAGGFFIQALVSEVLIMPLVYLVLLLMLRQRREQRNKGPRSCS